MTFGLYKGEQVSLLHQRRNSKGQYGLPYLCKLTTPIPSEYPDFLKRTTEDGYRSEKLIAVPEIVIYKFSSRDRKYIMGDHILMRHINAFKRICKIYITVKRLRIRARTRHIHEELVANVYHPRRIERYLEMGLSIDEICEL